MGYGSWSLWEQLPDRNAMSGRKIIFLDFDGVINSRQEQIWHYRTKKGQAFYEEFCPIACSNLAYLLELSPELRIVVSSTWRIGHTIEHLQEILQKNGISGDRVIGKTPLEGNCRGEQIQNWLSENGQEGDRFVIIDDDSDMGELLPHHVKTLTGNGFMFYEMIDVAKRLDIEVKGLWL